MQLTESQLRKIIKEELQAISPMHQLERIHGILRMMGGTLSNDQRASQLMRNNLEGIEALHKYLKTKMTNQKSQQQQQKNPAAPQKTQIGHK